MTDWPITPEAAIELFFLDRGTGEIYFRKRKRQWFENEQSCKTWNTRFAGKKTFTFYDKKKGEFTGCVLGRTMRRAVLVYCLTFGEWPKYRIGFIDGNKMNTRPDNLYRKGIAK